MRPLLGFLAVIWGLVGGGLAHGEQQGSAQRYDVRSYGIKCDGVTDDAPAMRSLLKLVDAAKGGDVVFPQSATPCMFGSAFFVPANTTLRAIPGKVVLKVTADNNSTPLLLNVKNVSNVKFVGLILDGGYPENKSINTTANVIKSNNILFDNTTIRNTNGIALLFSATVSHSGFRHGHLANVGGYNPSTPGVPNRQGIAFCCGETTENVGNFVEDSIFYQGGLDLVSISKQYQFKAVRNHLSTTSDGACIYAASNSDITLSDNQCDHAGGNGFDVFKNTDVHIMGGSSVFNGGAGYMMADTKTGQIIGVVAKDNFNQSKSVHRGGITIGGEAPDSGSSDIKIVGVISTDDQQVKTQMYGIQIRPHAVVRNICIDSSSHFEGNLKADFGEQAVKYRSSMAASCQ